MRSSLLGRPVAGGPPSVAYLGTSVSVAKAHEIWRKLSWMLNFRSNKKYGNLKYWQHFLNWTHTKKQKFVIYSDQKTKWKDSCAQVLLPQASGRRDPFPKAQRPWNAGQNGLKLVSSSTKNKTWWTINNANRTEKWYVNELFQIKHF